MAMSAGVSASGLAPPAALGVTSPTDATNRVIKRRAPVACRRCRRMRSKCIHNGARPPCEGCRIAGASLDECVFPSRGVPDLDREYRHPRMKGDKARKEVIRPWQSGSAGPAGVSPGPGLSDSASAADPWDLLPPLDLIIDAVNMFTYQYFQLGFLPRHTFAERLRADVRSVSPFLLFSVLSISGRLTPSLLAAYGDAETTAELFMSRASTMALAELYEEPTLARCQAFYLLSIAQQGSGYKNKSYLNLGIAIRMALLMQLHREETYALEDPTPSMIRQAESARRTLWMLYSQDNLHAAPWAPVSLAPGDITTLLPSNEHDFAEGITPKTRAALEDTPPATENPSLVNVPDRSLFASLIQSHRLWGIVSRRAVRNDKSTDPWAEASDYAQIQQQLAAWEAQLPVDHRWSPELFNRAKSEAYDLAYLIVPMVMRLCNIVIRKTYLPNMLQNGAKSQTDSFWDEMSLGLFSNVGDLFAQIDFWFQGRKPGDSTGAQMAIFCVYSCGLMSAYLCKYPHVCRKMAPEGKPMFERTLDILAQSKMVWPLARRWHASLERFLVADQQITNTVSNRLEGSMAEGKDPIPSALHPPLTHSRPPGLSKTPLDTMQYAAKQLRPGSPHARPTSPSSGSTQRLLLQLRANDSLPNARVRLPLPQPSPVLATPTTAAAPHYSAPEPHPQHAQQAQRAQFIPQQLFQLHQPPALPTPSSTSHLTAPLGQIQAQPSLPPPSMVLHSPLDHMLGGPASGMAASAASGAPPDVGPTRTAHSNIDLLVRAFDTPSAHIPLPSADVAYSQPLPHELLPNGTSTGAFYETAYSLPINDGFENELALMMVGSEAMAGTAWAPTFF